MIDQKDLLDNELKSLGLIRTVYSFYYPESREQVVQLWRSEPHELYDQSYLQRQSGLHQEFKKAWLQWTRPLVILDETKLPHFYPCQGSSEAIRELIAQIGVNRGRIHVFEGEYEGYSAYAEAFKVPVIKHDRDQYAASLKDVKAGDYFFLSQPSSLDGNRWMGFEDFIQDLEKRFPEIKVAVDLCYVGTTAPQTSKIDVTSPLITTVFMSLSKVFGVYYHRIGGVFHRDKALSLVGNEYFRNLFSLKLGCELLKHSSVHSFHQKYHALQKQLVAQAALKIPGLQAADCVLLGSGPKPAGELNPLQNYLLRKNHLRVCLTPGLDQAAYARNIKESIA